MACGQRATVVGARGSGDPQGGDVVSDRYGDQVHGMGKPGAAFAVDLANRLPRGEVTFDPVEYPAIGLLGNWRKIINAAGAASRLGFLGSYTGSVDDGETALRGTISHEAQLCPNVKLVLVGYSQGAQVVADVYQRDLTATQRSRIAGVVLFGDPYFNPADTNVDVGSFDPTRHGVLGKRALYPANAATHLFSICHHDDPICQGPGRDDFNQHTNYQSDLWVATAAAKIAAALRSTPSSPAEPVVLGGPYSSQYGFGTAHPARIWFGGDTTTSFWDLTWTNWGRSTATATGKSAGGVEPHTRVVAVRLTAYDIGVCEGKTAYLKLQIAESAGKTWVNLHGGPDDICTG